MRGAVLVVASVSVATPSTMHAQVPAPPAAGPQQWTGLTLSLDESWQTNPRFLASGSSSFVHRISADLSHSWTTPRLQVSLQGLGYGQLYSSFPNLNRFSYSGGADGLYLFSPSTALTVKEFYSSTYYESVPNTPTSGLPLPLVVTRSNSTTVSLSHKLSPETTVTPHFRYYEVSFSATGFTGGDMVIAGTDVRHAFGSKDGLLFLYDYQRSSAGALQRDANTAAAGWDHLFSTQVSGNALVGVSRYSGTGGNLTLPYADAGLSAKLQSTNFGIRYQHTVSQAFGLGRDRVGNYVFGTIGWRANRSLTVAASGGYGTNYDPLAPTFRFNTTNDQVSVNQKLTRRLFLGSYYRFSRFGSTGKSSLSDHSIGTFFTSALRWP